jgi:hypothetical protein
MADANSICSVPECGNIIKAKGWCNRHYLRWRRHGDPVAGSTSHGDPQFFLDEVIDAHNGDGCLLWPFARNSNGYAQIYRRGILQYVHRIVCERVNGAAPDGHEAAHSCGKGHEGCVSKRHILWKTHVDNIGDALHHGTRSRGERHGRAVLSTSDVKIIRAMSKTHEPNDIAEIFGVSASHVRAIQSRKSWKWLE